MTFNSSHRTGTRSMSKFYEEYYYSHNCGRPYQRDEEWLAFFSSVSDRILRDIGPGSALDAGCAMGFLVEALRSRGVDAWGVDVSEYAVDKIDPNVRPYCWVGTVTDELPQRYDLIICIEVLEHLSPDQSDRAIENFCRHSDHILFSSTPYDYKEATHFNVRPPDYWAQRFAQHGFFRDLDFDGSFVTPWTVLFRKTHDPAWRIVYAYERRLWQLEKEVQARRELTVEQQAQLAESERQIKTLIEEAEAGVSAKTKEHEAIVQALSLERGQFEQTVNSLRAELEQAKAHVHEVEAPLLTKISEHEQTVATLSAQILDQSLQLVARDADKDALNRVSEELSSHFQKIDSLITPLTTDQASINASLAKLMEHRKDLDALLSQLAEKEKAVTALSTDLMLAQNEIREWRTKGLEQQTLNAQLRLQLGEAKTTIENLGKWRSEKEQEIRDLSAALAASQSAVERAKSREKGAEFTIAALSQRLAQQKVDPSAELLASLAEKEALLADVNASMAWYLYNRLKYPYLHFLFRVYDRVKLSYLRSLYGRLGLASAQTAAALAGAETRQFFHGTFAVPVTESTGWPVPHTASVDVIICVHNALEDVRRCLESVIRHTRMPYSLIIVDDGSGEETRNYLVSFADSQKCVLIRNEQARGYTLAANQGLNHSQSEYALLLNSDTVVTPLWLDRMISCGESDPRIGMVGPLSNAASWQSTPEISQNGDWGTELPPNLTAADMSKLLSDYSPRLYPRIPFLNGFCVMIKKHLLDQIGYFDESAFGRGFGEENDFSLRAAAAGWELAIADDAFVYHAQSRSYSHERRRELAKQADIALAAKHDQNLITRNVATCQTDRVLEGMRARNKVLLERQQNLEAGMRRWEGKRITFILTIASACGGGNVVLDEAEAMRQMGVDVRLLNLARNQIVFERSYPDNRVPVIYAQDISQIGELTADSDAVIATSNDTVYWLKDCTGKYKAPVKAYYVQDFEPYFSDPEVLGFRIAWNSYTEYPDLVLFTKTEWNSKEVHTNTGATCSIVGPSTNIDLNRPRRRHYPNWPERPLHIAAMIRPSTPRRNPRLTMEVLREVQRARGETVAMILFGCEASDPEFLALPQDFAWQNAGMLTRPQVASLLNEVDIFVDFSSFQAMGLTAMEAMACGAAVIMPQKGGGESFATHNQSILTVDTSSKEACVNELERLVTDESLRVRLQQRGLVDICKYYPEKTAYNILNLLFPGTDSEK